MELVFSQGALVFRGTGFGSCGPDWGRVAVTVLNAALVLDARLSFFL